MSKVAEIFESLDYGPAPESAAPVLSWLDAHERALKVYINGEWITPASGEAFDTANPATGQPLASIAQAGQPEVDAAVKAARKAFESWSKLSGHERARYLYAIARQILTRRSKAPAGSGKRRALDRASSARPSSTSVTRSKGE